MHGVPAEVRDFAGTFIVLQKARERADYAREGQDDKLGVLATIDVAETAIAQLDRASVQHRRSFAAHMLFKRRPLHRQVRRRAARPGNRLTPWWPGMAGAGERSNSS